MPKLRFSIAGLMGIVLVAAVGLAALVSPSPAWAGAIFLVTCVVLGLAIVGAIYRRGASRAFWVGVCVFGWGYLALLTLVANYGGGILPSPPSPAPQMRIVWALPFPPLLTSQILSTLRVRLGPEVPSGGEPQWQTYWNIIVPYYQIGHALWALLAGLVGGTLARIFLALPPDRSGRPEPAADAVGERPRRRWLRSAVIAWVGLMLACSAAAIRSGPDAGTWAGAAFLLTCGLIGMACLAAIFGRARRRQAGVGAVLFGAGYLLLVFARAPYQMVTPGLVRTMRSIYQPLPTSSLLIGLRRWASSITGGSGAANARIMAVLEQPIAMPFPDPTPIQDVLRYVTLATATPTQPGIPIYLDPISLEEAERTPTSTVKIDLVGVPLKTSLRLCLDQLGLGYYVRDGCLEVRTDGEDEKDFGSPDLMIAYDPRRNGPDSVDLSSDLDDPFLVVGHCLLALVAASFGAVAAPMVAEPRTPTSSSPERT
jgi:hypothetical protein